MDSIKSIQQIRELFSSVRDKRKGFITNFFIDEFKHLIWIEKGVLFFESLDNTVFLVKESYDFWNVFFAATNTVDFSNDLLHFKEKYVDATMMFDIVGRNEQCSSILTIFQEKGFLEYCSLVRMNRITSTMDNNKFISNVSKATIEQITDIYILLNKYFDKRTEQIPFIEELEEYARLNHILVYTDGNKIIGFLIFEINASTLYLRYWFVHPNYRDKKIGSTLLRSFFDEGKNTKRQFFWVIKSNDNALKRYKHYGFTEENMFDYVLTSNNNILYEGTDY
jgi:ribosomal protein S18 acetylase RimI-like enzyme